MTARHFLAVLGLTLATSALTPVPASAQQPTRLQLSAGTSMQGPAGGSVPSAPVTDAPLRLTLADALARARTHNLAVLRQQDQVDAAQAARLRSLAALLPRVDARVTDVRQTTNLAAFGFDTSLFPGMRSLVGPYSVFDARVGASLAVVDRSASQDLVRTRLLADAAALDVRTAHDLVTLVTTTLYLQGVAGASRIDAVREEVTTAEALVALATELRNAGATPGIDLVRAQVQLRIQQQRLIAAETEFGKLCMQLARAIGVPVSQALALADRDIHIAVPTAGIDALVASARAQRADLQALTLRVTAAEADMRKVASERLPSLHISGDIGTIGSTPSNALRTYGVGGAVRVPLFDVGRTARAREAEATWHGRQSEAADLAERIEADVRSAALDLEAARQQHAVALERTSLSRQELHLARIRFSAGVAGNLEVIQAQEAVAAADENEIVSAYALNVAKAALNRAIGAAQ